MKIEITIKGIDALFSFFAESEQISYQSPHKLIPQFSKYTCAAACARMLLADFGIDAPESYLASALDTSDGAFLSKVPEVLKEFGGKTDYEWRNNLTITDLSKAIKSGSAIVLLQRKNTNYGHALIVDDIIDAEIRLRDPLPIGQGKSYAVSLETFAEGWLNSGVVLC